MTEATQVGTSVEDQQMQFVQRMIQLYQDAANAPALRREVEGLRAEVETLNKTIGDLRAEIELEKEAHGKARADSIERNSKISQLQSKLARFERRFDSLRGIVVEAIKEIEADKAEQEPKPWNPSGPFRSVG